MARSPARQKRLSTGKRHVCCIVHCRRTTRDTGQIEPPDDLWICGPHYALVPRRMKTVRQRARRHLRRHPDDPAALVRYMRLSARLTRAAREAAAGIG